MHRTLPCEFAVLAVDEKQEGCGSRAKFIRNYWFAVICRVLMIQQTLQNVIRWLWGYHAETGHGDDLVAERIQSDDVLERMQALVVCEVPDVDGQAVRYSADGAVDAGWVLCQLTLVMDEFDESFASKQKLDR